MAPSNVLLIYTDQHRYDCVGFAGHPFVRTPNIDRLAAEGMHFTQAYCPIPLCVPARNTMHYGQWPVQHLCICNRQSEAPRAARPGLPTFVDGLRRAGYFLGIVGKWDVDFQRGPEEYGYTQYVPEEAYSTWRSEQGLPAQPSKEDWRGQVDPHINPEQSRPGWGAAQVLNMVAGCRASGRRFFIRWDPGEPHLPNIVPEPYASMYRPDEIPPWPTFPDPLTNKPYAHGQQLRNWGVVDWDWDQWAPIVGRYLGAISLLDAQVGRLLEGLEHLGLSDDTLVIYTSDHGGMCGSHGMMDKHNVMYDDVVRVNLVARWPGRIPPGTTCDAFVSNSLDLPTTFCEVAGVPVPDTFRGLSLLPLFEGAQTNGRQDILSMYHGNQFGLYSERMVRDRRWKYVWNPTALDELYDLETDPAELTNLARDPGSAAELRRLRDRLIVWMEEISDPLLNSWTRSVLEQGLAI
jgi:arylsulfatase A-like enzyme